VSPSCTHPPSLRPTPLGQSSIQEHAMIKEFKEFISRGNVVDLAVAVIIGIAFGLVVKSFSDDILGQLLAAVGGKPDLTDLVLPLRTTVGADGRPVEIGLRYGAFLTAIVNFAIVAFSLFLIVKAIHKMESFRSSGDATDVAEEQAETEIELLTDIRELLAGRDAKADVDA
jgi:large conductance mechanosensitive channel